MLQRVQIRHNRTTIHRGHVAISTLSRHKSSSVNEQHDNLIIRTDERTRSIRFLRINVLRWINEKLSRPLIVRRKLHGEWIRVFLAESCGLKCHSRMGELHQPFECL